MEKARYNTELYSNLKVPLDNVKPSNFWGSYHFWVTLIFHSVFIFYPKDFIFSGFIICLPSAV